MDSLTKQNKQYWQQYTPGKIPTTPKYPPAYLLQRDSTVLDVGTGDGILAEYCASKGCKVWAVDVAKNLIRENKHRNTNVKYSIGDITERLDFPNNYFDLVLFRFVLANIHKDSWSRMNREIVRILKERGRIWVLEPLVSPSYKDRYKLASNFVTDKHCVYVFKDLHAAEKTTTKEDLSQAINSKLVSRIIKHYEIDELKLIFFPLELSDFKEFTVKSPSGYDIRTFEGIFVK